MSIIVQDSLLDVSREPLIHPFGFKGGCFTEKWLTHVTLTGASGCRASSLGSIAVLWADANVFLAHTETGGNLLMAAMLEKAVVLARGMSFDVPEELLDRLLEPVHEYGRSITENPHLSRTFTLNSLVGLDNAAWVFYALEQGRKDFSGLLGDDFRQALSCRHQRLGVIPLVSYSVPVSEVEQLADAGHFVFKIKIGAPGSVEEMLAKDQKRLAEIHAAIGETATPHTDCGKILYYLDANGRYPDREHVMRLLEHADKLGMRDRIMVLEEPYAEESTLAVGDLGVRVAADESLHDVQALRKRIELGYTAAALKPAGKTMSMTLRMAACAHEHGIPCFVADSACVPLLVDWNKNVAARLPVLPGVKTGLMESNGAQHYSRWQAMLDEHPRAGATWIKPECGVFNLDDDFYGCSGGIFDNTRTNGEADT